MSARFRSGRVNGGIDSAMRTSARQPSATAPSRCRFWCGASPAAAQCDVYVSRSEWMPHHSRGRLAHRRPAPGSTASASQGRNRINQGQGLLRVVRLPGQANCEWDAPRITDQMPFAPALGAIGGIRTCQRAATSAHRATVNDGTRPINFAVRASQLRRTKCIRSQTPSCCQSRRRRQQVIPDPQPSSFGNICHGIPLRSTKGCRETGAIRDARPSTVRSRRTAEAVRFHSASGNSTAAINRRR